MKRIALALVVASVSCATYDLVGPASNSPPSLHVFVSVMQSSNLQYGVSAVLFPGSDARGFPNALADSTMLIEGEAVRARAEDDLLVFPATVRQIDDPAMLPDSLHLRAPEVSGVNASPWTVSIPFPRRSRAYVIDHVIGHDLTLELPAVFDTTGTLVRRGSEWQVSFAKGDEDGPLLLHLSAEGRNPQEMRFDLRWFTDDVSAGDSLIVRFVSLHSYDAPNAPYTASLTIFHSISWVVRLAAAPPAP